MWETHTTCWNSRNLKGESGDREKFEAGKSDKWEQKTSKEASRDDIKEQVYTKKIERFIRNFLP